MALDVYVIRHGETAWSRSGQHTGRTDLPLLPEGEEQARQLAEHLRGIDFVAVWSSDRARAIRTA
ncbi:MAG TPA: histidine phosphatase family protein, partial [Candidatus Dormibacteraeota bacterium]